MRHDCRSRVSMAHQVCTRHKSILAPAYDQLNFPCNAGDSSNNLLRTVLYACPPLAQASNTDKPCQFLKLHLHRCSSLPICCVVLSWAMGIAFNGRWYRPWSDVLNTGVYSRLYRSCAKPTVQNQLTSIAKHQQPSVQSCGLQNCW